MLSKKEQIQEMARITCSIYRSGCLSKECCGSTKCDFICSHYERCEKLYNEGYRKHEVNDNDS